MFLRSLTLRGFKSFADKTVLEFGPGVAAVVGPNGSGKSNLADAVAWVLGEQGPRALRGAQMADVVFAGSPGRAALGMAQVSLVIDNTAGLIPVQASEIEVARVVYRSGESQYLIGGEPCRLLDIQELLSDTGIGRGLHAVVSQGHLEDVLVARPEERRQMIEEAAGIAKHRKRKERAQRRLASLEQDLLRLQDVVAEVRRHLKPLKHQAEAARRHETLSEEAATMAWKLAAARLRDLYADRERRRSGWEVGRARRSEAEGRLAALDKEIAETRERLATSEQELAEAESAQELALRGRLAAEASLREAVRAEGEARARAAADAGRSGRLFSLEEEARRTAAALADAAAALSEKEASLEGAERAFVAARDARRDVEDERRRAHEAAASRRAEVEMLGRTLRSAEAERDRLALALEELARKEAGLRAEHESFEVEVERLDAEETPLADRQHHAEQERDRLAGEVADIESRARALEASREAVVAKRKALADTPGKRFLARAGERSLGLLIDLLDVRRGMERAVAAALGPLADAVVYDDHGRAVADAPGARGATLAVTGDTGSGFLLPGERSLLSVVRPDPRVAGVVSGALRHVFLAADPEEALEKHRRHPAASFVTSDGVLVGPGLVRTAPTPTEDELAARREEVAAVRDLARARKELDEKRSDLKAVTGELAEIAQALAATDAKITEAAERMGSLGVELAAADRERTLLSERLAGVEHQIHATRAALAAVPSQEAELPPLPPHAEPPVTLRVEIEALRRERVRLEAGLARSRAELDRLRAQDPEALAEQAEDTAQVLAAAESALREAEDRAGQAATARERAAPRAGEERAAEARANEAWRDAAAQLQRLRDEYEDEDQVRRDLERRIEEAERLLAEGHEKEPGAAVAELGDDDTVESLARRSDLVSRRLGLLGRVNLVAGEEYDALQERHDFLRREIEDVKEARADLAQVVREVDRKIVEIFDAAYRDVAGEFGRVFATLFPGGEGKLTLTEPERMLEAGVEIEARPGGKRVKRLTLLSGGERSLTALAFLFAIFRARPSPFYLLDEVEAALDDRNLVRFLELVKEFARTSQVLLVTHQKRTMEAADVLYGVSMGRDGSSAIIAQRLSEVSARR
ncbi:MAG: AAA family ATPase [Actinomycetota bacterium]